MPMEHKIEGVIVEAAHGTLIGAHCTCGWHHYERGRNWRDPSAADRVRAASERHRKEHRHGSA